MRAADFSGRSIVLATMHGKERAFGPILADRLGMEIVVPPGLDTDTLGTFSGEVSRPGSMEETAIAKARLGASVAGCELALASEGAYGPHPTVPFVAAGLELVVLLDTRSGRVVREHLIDERLVYDHVTIEPGADLDEPSRLARRAKHSRDCFLWTGRRIRQSCTQPRFASGRCSWARIIWKVTSADRQRRAT